MSTCANKIHQCFFFLCITAELLMRAKANGQVFLGSRDQHFSLHSHGASDLLSELGRVVGQDQRLATERRVDRLEDALRPMFKAMPKDRNDRLSATSVRYVLHRLFVQRHGWLVTGLQNVGDKWNSSSPTDVIKSTAGEEVHKVFDETLSSKGFTLNQMAVLAATLENLVHNDNVERLQVAYRMTGISLSQAELSEKEAADIIKAYMLMYVLSFEHATLGKDEFDEASSAILSIYPTWPGTETFVDEVRKSVLADFSASERTTWNATLRVLEEVGERYGKWQNKECHDLKKTLVEMEDPGTGRVPLTRFYKSALENISWQFMESIPYLRQLGALDETDPEAKSVVIPNYVYSPSNCVASSTFYSVCCIDECEALLGVLERSFGAPDATPNEISALISKLPSDTVMAPRNLPESLNARLQEIATHHGGRVPLHGRLFAQWMHHAYPRECPYPHLSGTTNPLVAIAFMQETGEDVEISHDEMREIMQNSKSIGKTSTDEKLELPWSAEEELFVSPERPAFALTQLSGAHQAVVWLSAACSMGIAFWRFQQQGVGLSNQKPVKFHV